MTQQQNTSSGSKPKARVLVGLSGGVDSAVAAHLLLQEGYEVIAGFMKNYADESNPNCHTREDRNSALKVAQHLGIKTFIIFDFREEYHQAIIQYIYDGYQKGLTPNPDVLCNTEIKFKLFLEEGIKLGCEYVATGHYAQINTTKDGIFQLKKGIDPNKDQSYFLSGLDQYQLSKSIFPLGSFEKPEIRKIAHDIGLPNADRKDSQGLCFIGKVPIKDFLQEALPIKSGEIKDLDGNILGSHDGAHFFTIGQRTGLGLSGGPWYVIRKDTDTNELIVSKDEQKDLMHSELTASNWHWIGEKKPLPRPGFAKIRYRQEDQACTLSLIPEDDSVIHIAFDQAQRAISPGQIVVVYDEVGVVVGSGIIG